MTDENEIAIYDRRGYLDAVATVEAVTLPTADGLSNVPGATDADSATSAVVAAVLDEARAALPAADTAITGAAATLRTIYTQVTGADAAGETRVQEA